ncbi:MAG: threonylcarbamoyl-AMP synthase, partial [Flavobacteriales bacterium]|jgi:tRNA threonylcarbamoyl adenosine modification protein (Sua5/YciO/YrdC/YwlC family)|nr:threonylcarbamoyl-AMP synthase [Flavobacteriales bacterium]
METQYLRVNRENINSSEIQIAVKCLKEGGIIIYPTDTVYAMGCDVNNARALERLAKLKGILLKNARMAIIVNNLSHLSDFARVDTPVFKILKRCLPGPFTFILSATQAVPRLFQNKQKTIGLRIPDHPIPLEIVRQLGSPLVTTSIVDQDDIIEYTTDPSVIYENFKGKVDMVIDGGYGNNIASTLVDCTGEAPVVLRIGLGQPEDYGL